MREYLPLLRKNKVDEAGLYILTMEDLKKIGVGAIMDQVAIIEAAKR